MFVKLVPNEMALLRWCFRLIDDMGDAGIIDDPDTDCQISLDGHISAFLKVHLKNMDDTEILNEIMENNNIDIVVEDSDPDNTYRLHL